MIFTHPVSEFMTSNVVSVGSDVMLPRVATTLSERRVSALAVTDDQGSILGVISRTDLVRVGRSQAGSHRKASALVLPEKRVGDLVRERARAPVTVGPTETLKVAAQRMIEERVHRLFVIDNKKMVGVVSTLDMMSAVAEAKIEVAISEIMSKPLFSVKAQQPIGMAIERLEHARVSGLVVTDDEWPVGVFTQIEAMEARDLPRDTRVDEVLDPSMLCLPTTTKLFRAAAQARRLEVRRIIPCLEREAVGIVTGFDFAKVVAA